MVCQFVCINLNLDVNAIQPYYTLTYTSPVCTYYLPVYLPFFINLKESKESITSSRIVYFSKYLIESAEKQQHYCSKNKLVNVCQVGNTQG